MDKTDGDQVFIPSHRTDNGGGVAVIGASPRNFWALCAIRNLTIFGDGKFDIWPVTPNHSTVMGLDCYRGVSSLPGAPTAAVIAIGRESCVSVVRELVDAGTPDIVLVSNGFSELKDGVGPQLELELAEICRTANVRLIGPNCVGFADFNRGLCAIAEPIPVNVKVGDVTFITQSGALLSSTLSGFVEEGLGADLCVSVGNGAVIGVAEAIQLAATRESTKVITAYMEGLPGAHAVELFRAAVIEARRNGKHVVILKSGSSLRGKRAVLSHTASIAGTDTVFSSMLDSIGATRVFSVDELIRTATIARLGSKEGRAQRVAIVGSSGGVAALSSDLASSKGVDLAVFTKETTAVLEAASGPGSFIENPFDIVGKPGASMGNDVVYEAVYSDPNVGFVLAPFSVNFPDDTPEREPHRQTFLLLARLAEKYNVPTVITSVPITEWSPWARQFQFDYPHVPIVRGMATCFSALAHLFPDRSDRATRSGTVPKETDIGSPKVLSESASRAVLVDAGISVVKGASASSVDDAGQLSKELRAPMAVKVIAPVSHKMAIGGVELGCSSSEEVELAAERIQSAVLGHGLPAHQLEGYLIEEMAFGSELLVGLNTDELLGKYLVVGLGGRYTELANVATTRLLPVTQQEIIEMLSIVGMEESRPARDFIAKISDSFVHGQLSQYESVEVNPAIVTSSECLAADAVVFVRS